MGGIAFVSVYANEISPATRTDLFRPDVCDLDGFSRFFFLLVPAFDDDFLLWYLSRLVVHGNDSLFYFIASATHALYALLEVFLVLR